MPKHLLSCSVDFKEPVDIQFLYPFRLIRRKSSFPHSALWDKCSRGSRSLRGSPAVAAKILCASDLYTAKTTNTCLYPGGSHCLLERATLHEFDSRFKLNQPERLRKFFSQRISEATRGLSKASLLGSAEQL